MKSAPYVLAGILMGVALAMDPWAMAFGGAGVGLALMLFVRWRYGPVLGRAAELAKAHLFGNTVLPEAELRALSEAVILGPRGLKWGPLRIFAR